MPKKYQSNQKEVNQKEHDNTMGILLMPQNVDKFKLSDDQID